MCPCLRRRPREQRLLLNYNTQRHAVFTDTLTIEDEKCSSHADLFVHLFPRVITSQVPTRKMSKFQPYITYIY